MKIKVAVVLTGWFSAHHGMLSVLVCNLITANLWLTFHQSHRIALWFSEVREDKPVQEVCCLLKELGKRTLSIQKMQGLYNFLSFPTVCVPCANLSLGIHGAWMLKSQLISTSMSMVACDRGTVVRLLTSLFNFVSFILIGWSEKRISGSHGQWMP